MVLEYMIKVLDNHNQGPGELNQGPGELNQGRSELNQGPGVLG